MKCPECGSEVKVSLDDLAKKRTKTCGQGHEFRVTDQAAEVGRKVKKAQDDMLRKVRRLGK